MSEFHAEAPQATASEGLAKGPYVAVRVGFETTTLRTKGVESTNEPPCPKYPNELADLRDLSLWLARFLHWDLKCCAVHSNIRAVLKDLTRVNSFKMTRVKVIYNVVIAQVLFYPSERPTLNAIGLLNQKSGNL